MLVTMTMVVMMPDRWPVGCCQELGHCFYHMCTHMNAHEMSYVIKQLPCSQLGVLQ
jgi:hypothetical protein